MNPDWRARFADGGAHRCATCNNSKIVSDSKVISMAKSFPTNPSPALAGYLPAFLINPNAVFISYFAIGNDKELVRSNLTRLEFWERARCAAGALTAAGLGKGDRFVLYMTDNRLEDMILRLASVMVGCAVSCNHYNTAPTH